MAGEWVETTLGQVIELKRGYDLPHRDRKPGSVPLVSSSGVTDHHSEAKVKGPGVVTGRYGTLGEVFFVADDFWPLNTALYVRDFKGNDPRFVSYFLTGLDFLSYSDKAAVPGLNRNHLHLAKINFPTDTDEQRAIAHILGTLDDKIELNRRMSATLEAMARALFKSWFVDFEPVRTKSEGRDPGLPSHLAALFPDRFSGTGEGDIPEGWNWRRLDQLATPLSGGTPRKSDETLWAGSLPWVSPKSMGGLHVRETPETVAMAAVGRGTRLAPRGSIFVMVRGMGLHKGLRISQARREMAFNQDVKALVPTQTSSGFLLFGLLSREHELHSRVKPSGHGTGVLETEVLVGTQLARPPAENAEVLAAPFDEMNERIAVCECESQVLSTLRETLLPKLISGELRVKDAEKIASKVA